MSKTSHTLNLSPLTPLWEDPNIVPLLRSGRLPSPLELKHLEALLFQVDSCIDEDEKHISQLYSQISQLRERVQILEFNQQILESLSAPIRKTPPELMQQIFELAVDTNEFKDLKSMSSAVRISSVCAQWRSIAHATPRIWSGFLIDLDGPKNSIQPFSANIPPPPPNKNNSKLFVDSIDRHLRLSRDAELHLDVRATRDPSELCSQILELFAPHASRWRSAKFKVGPISGDTQKRLQVALQTTPRLKSLHIYALQGSVDSGISLDFFESCPELKELSAIQYKPHNGIPWLQLTSIHFAVSRIAEIDTVLDLCPKLRSLSLIVPTASTLETSSSEIVPKTLPIRTLTIRSRSVAGGRAQTGVQRICNALTLPRLHSLTILSSIYRKYRAIDEPRHEIGYWPQAAVEGMLVRSACKLESLRLEGVPLDTDEAIRLLRLTPHAGKVSLHECPTTDPEDLSERRIERVGDDIGANHFVTEDLLKDLRVKSELSGAEAIPHLLPRLRRLELKVNESFPLDAYMSMIRTRWPGPDAPRVLPTGVDRLDAVSLVYRTHECDWIDVPDNPDVLLKLKAEGLLVKYSDGCDTHYEYKDKYRPGHSESIDYSESSDEGDED
ncbi:F-box domain-containing protein [Favolaschia claudopus]|uniref:F-box domain-containing protein n=1 Tax=Favolaschia claudopus TaxID=2862362 RepID=A0AAW0E7L0_9AGAR